MAKQPALALTPRQLDVLGVVSARGPVTTLEVSENLLDFYDRAHSALVSLERKGMVERDYTSRRTSGRHSWVIRNLGRVTLERHLDEASSSMGLS